MHSLVYRLAGLHRSCWNKTLSPLASLLAGFLSTSLTGMRGRSRRAKSDIAPTAAAGLRQEHNAPYALELEPPQLCNARSALPPIGVRQCRRPATQFAPDRAARVPVLAGPGCQVSVCVCVVVVRSAQCLSRTHGRTLAHSYQCVLAAPPTNIVLLLPLLLSNSPCVSACVCVFVSNYFIENPF